MDIKRLNCPVCEEPMIMKEFYDHIRKLVCEKCLVTKEFLSWEEQTQYSELYKLNQPTTEELIAELKRRGVKTKD